MNLLEILRSRVSGLPEGEYIQGLKAVLQHIEVASKHLDRGQTSADETAFTDAIYRTNQAFEGSLKEAYRVLTAKDPSRESPNTIENYLQDTNVLRRRVLAQLTNYRREWRNPSTHDYRLDFDEDEALLAIVTVSVFAIVLIDQIIEKVSYNKAKTVAAESPSPSPSSKPLPEQITFLLQQFVNQFNIGHAERRDIREAEIIGALGGFLSAAAPNLTTQSDEPLGDELAGVDFIIISPENEKLILEVKRGRYVRAREDSINQVIRYMETSNIDQAVLFLYSGAKHNELFHQDRPVSFASGRLGQLRIISSE